MNILMPVGSPRQEGNSFILAKEFKMQAEKRGHKCDIINLNEININSCEHCGYCAVKNKCKIKDDLTDILNKFNNYDTLILVSPIYFFYLTSQTKTFLDRLYSVDKLNKDLGAILISGSDFFEGGSDLVVNSLQRVCSYCEMNWLGVIQKTTNDEVLPLNEIDKINISKLIDNIEFKDLNNSYFIQN